MCFHKSLLSKHDELMQHYAASFDSITEESELVRYHENGFDFKNTPIVTAGRPDAFQFFSWGLIPHWVKDEASGKKLRVQTLNCVSEEMYDKPSFRDAAINNQRCLVPCSGFYEWRWVDEKGKTKIPYYIGLKDQNLFSLAGIYSRWKNMETGQYQFTYSVLTTIANPLMETIHNSKKRMPVIIPKKYEKDWLNKNLTREDVLAFCTPIDEKAMRAFTISKRITSRTEDTNIPEVLAPHEWLEGSPDKQGSLF